MTIFLKVKKKTLIILFSSILMDLVGFGMLIPLMPYLSRNFGASDLQIGFLMSVYSIAQLCAAPFWGWLSDRFGRRPILLINFLGTALAHFWFGWAGSILHLFLARVLSGVFGASISTAYAYIADITNENDRSKNMGLIGMAFGLGFVIGPFLGGLLSVTGAKLGTVPPFGSSFVAIVAAIICLSTLFLQSFF